MEINNYRIVKCPICNREVGKHCNKSTTIFMSRCRKCKKKVIYDPDTGETTYKDFPQKNTSSGVSFN